MTLLRIFQHARKVAVNREAVAAERLAHEEAHKKDSLCQGLKPERRKYGERK